MRIDAFKKIFFSMKGGYLRIFMSTDTFKNYFQYKEGLFENFCEH